MQFSEIGRNSWLRGNVSNGGVRLCVLLVFAIASVAIVGWLFDLRVLASFGVDNIPMAPSTAILFLLSSGSVFIRVSFPLRRWSRIAELVAVSSVGFVALVLLLLSLFGIYTSIEHLGLSHQSAYGLPLGHMSPLTAFCFLVFALAFYMSGIPGVSEARRGSFARWVASVLVIISVVLVLAYLYGMPLMYDSGYVPPAVTTSIAFLFLGIAVFGMDWMQEEQSSNGNRKIRQRGYVLALVFLVLATGLITISLLHFRRVVREYREEVELRLTAVAELKVNDFVQWRKERLGDGLTFQKNTSFSKLVRRLIKDSGDVEARVRVQSWMENLQLAYDYNRICLHDATGVELLSVPDTPHEHTENWQKAASEALDFGKVIFSDFNRNEHDKQVYLRVLVPIPDGEENLPFQATLAMRIDPYTYLYPFINRWPTPTQSAETLLVRRDGDDVLFLNPLKFRPDAALNFRIPLDNTDLPATRAVLGETGIVRGYDYRGVAVLAYVCPIPETPWFLVSRMDLSEIYAPLRQRFWMLIAFVCSLLVASGVTMYSLWRRQRVFYFKERYEAAEELRLQEERYRHTLDDMLEGCQIVGRDWKFLYVNETAARHSKKTQEELLGHTCVEVFPGIENASFYKKLKHCMEDEVAEHLEVEFVYEDGSIGYFYLSIEPVPEGLFILSSDITERKKAEARLNHLANVLRALRSVNHLITHEKDRAVLLRRACEILIKTRGYRSAWIALGTSVKNLRAVAEAGVGESFAAVCAILEKEKYPECCLLAMERVGVVTMRDINRNCHNCPLAQIYPESAAFSGALRHGDITYGVLIVALAEEVADDAEEQSLFVELCEDIGFALHSIEMEQERQRNLEALSESERFAHATIDGLSAHICVLDSNGVIIAMNKSWHVFTAENGLAIDKVKEGVNYFDICAVTMGNDLESSSAFIEGIKAVINGETSMFVKEYSCSSLSGERWFVGRVTRFPGEGVVNVVVAHENITDRKQAINRMLHNQLMLARTEKVAHIGSWEWEPATDTVTWSSEMFRIFQIDPTAGAPSFAEQAFLFHPEDWPQFQEVVNKSLAQDIPYELEVRVVRRDEEIRTCLVRGYVDAGRDKQVKRLYGSFQDITDHRRVDQEKKSLQMQLHQAQKMEAVGQLAGGVAHDFNNILQAMMGYTQMLIDEAEDKGEETEELAEIYKGAERAATLTRQLLSFSRRQVMQPKTVDLNTIVENLLKMLRRVIGEHIKVNWWPGSKLGATYADAGMLEQVLMNLCVNARDAMPKEGILNIETQNVLIEEDYCRTHAWASPGRYVLLSVTDTGTGIDGETLEHIFEPFFTTKQEGKGTGLGLATVYGIIKQHDGMITVYSEMGKGTTFKIYLPVCEQKAASVGKMIEGAVVGGTETILIAEDDEAVRDSGSRILERSGYTVYTAKNGEEAVSIFREHAATIDLVLLDVVMPIMGGHEAHKHILNLREDVPVLFTSGYSENAVHTNFVLHDGVRLIQKPYSLVTLLRAVRAALDESNHETNG